MLFISRPHGEPVGPVDHHLHDPNIYFHWRKSCWPPCCSWMAKGNYRMKRLPPLVPALDCGTWLWWRSISWECAPPGDQHLLQTAAGDIHEREELLLEYLAKSLRDFFFLCFSWYNLNMSRGSLWSQQQLPQTPEKSWPGTVSYTEFTSPTKLGKFVFLWWVIATASAAIKKITACSPSPLSPKSNIGAALLALGKRFWKPCFVTDLQE